MNAVDMALKMEQEAVEFYRKCAEKTTSPIGKKMFLSIMDDEQYHIACAVNMKKGEKVVPAKATPLEDMKQLFDRHKQEMLSQVSSTADELDAFRIAMKMEEEAIAFYRSASGQASTAEEKNFFDCLIRDEEEHLRIFRNTHTFLEDTGNWFMWEQQGIVEG